VIHFLGPPGTGKSHLATALGVEAVKAGRSVYFASPADIVGALAKAEREGQLRKCISFLCRPSVLIVDEIGYLPVVPGGGNLFFQLVNARYERGAMILTSNRGFAEWGEVLGDPVVATALLDRLLHQGPLPHLTQPMSLKAQNRALQGMALQQDHARNDL
jgi:DNA replication protein DnaC